MFPQLNGSKMRSGLIGLYFCLAVSAAVGVAIGGGIFLLTVLVTTGPFGFVTILPSVFVTVTFWVFIVPVWASLMGWLGLRRAKSRACQGMQVKMFPKDDPLVRDVHALAKQAGLQSMPSVGYYMDEAPNAFASGSAPENAVVAFSSGLFSQLDGDQVRAVAAHEIGHIVTNDMARMQFARAFQNSLVWFLMFQGLQNFVRWLVTPLSEIAILSLSRSREYRADAVAAALTTPDAMMSALEALGQSSKRDQSEANKFANLMIKSTETSWFSTHPSMPDRIAALKSGAHAHVVQWKTPNKNYLETNHRAASPASVPGLIQSSYS